MDPLPETRTRFKNNGPAASRRRFWTGGDGSDGPAAVARSIHSIGIVVPLQRTIERTPTVLVVMSPESIVKSAAALVLQMEMQGLIVRSRKFGVRRVNSLFLKYKIGNSPV